VLGGIWADQSWGRFWGWDPKENGALLIVIWCAIILHARWGKIVRERGLMLMAIFGNVVTAFSWFGVNMLGIGLHSYGFMDEAFSWLVLFGTSQVLLISDGAMPRCFWRNPEEVPTFSPRGIRIAITVMNLAAFVAGIGWGIGLKFQIPQLVLFGRGPCIAITALLLILALILSLVRPSVASGPTVARADGDKPSPAPAGA
jgi:hypothetical protein